MRVYVKGSRGSRELVAASVLGVSTIAEPSGIPGALVSSGVDSVAGLALVGLLLYCTLFATELSAFFCRFMKSLRDSFLGGLG